MFTLSDIKIEANINCLALQQINRWTFFEKISVRTATCSGLKGNAQFIFLRNPKKSSVNVYLMKILKALSQKNVIVFLKLKWRKLLKVAVSVIFPSSIMVLFEIHQRFKGHFLNELRVSFKVHLTSLVTRDSQNGLRSSIYFLRWIFWKTNICYPLWACQGVRNIFFFLESFVFILNSCSLTQWTLGKFCVRTK